MANRRFWDLKEIPRSYKESLSIMGSLEAMGAPTNPLGSLGVPMDLYAPPGVPRNPWWSLSPPQRSTGCSRAGVCICGGTYRIHRMPEVPKDHGSLNISRESDRSLGVSWNACDYLRIPRFPLETYESLAVLYFLPGCSSIGEVSYARSWPRRCGKIQHEVITPSSLELDDWKCV